MFGRINYGYNYGPNCISSCGDTAHIRIDNGSGGPLHAGVEPFTINNLGFSFSNLKTFTLTLGVTSAIQGDYGSFTLGWDSMSVHLKVDARARAELDLGITFGLDIANIHLDFTIPVNVVWHLMTNHYGVPAYSNGLFSLDTPIPCGCHGFLCLDIDFYDVDIALKPHAHTYATNHFTVSPPGASEGSAWLVVPDPYDWVPDTAIFIIAALTSPIGGGADVNFPCRD
jgi:hypothetical protein